MIRIDVSYRITHTIFPSQIIIEYPIKGRPANQFNHTDEENIGYWQVESSTLNELTVVKSVYGIRHGKRTLTEDELMNGRWWVRK